jgi:hypothetical protein
MAVAHVTQWRASPGRTAELLELGRQAAKVNARLGARARMMQSLVAGPNSNIINYIVEFDDMAAYSKWADALATDAEFQGLIAKYLAVPNPVGTSISTSLLRDIPL